MAELRNWQPGWIDRARHTAQGMLAPLFGGDERAAMAYVDDKVKPTLEYMPGVGDAMAAAEARDEFAKGNYGMGGLLAAGAMAGLVPGVGDAVQKGTRKVAQALKDPMIATHNLSAEKLKFADQLGGMPMPSIAASKVDHPLDKFGDITLVADPSMVTPSKSNRVWAGDAYTGRQPRGEQVFVNHDETLTRLNQDPRFAGIKWMSDLYTMTDDIGRTDQYLKSINAAIDAGLVNPADYKDAFELARASEKALGYNVPEGVRGIDAYGETEWVLPQGFTPSGNRKKPKPYTLENVMAEMRKDQAGKQGSENWNYGASSFRANQIAPLRSFDDVKASRDRILPKEQTKEAFEAFTNEYNDLVEQIANSSGVGGMRGFDAAAEFMSDYAAGRGHLWRDVPWTREVPPELLDNVKSLSQRARELPANYIEAKPQRAVSIGEFKGALVPQGQQQAIDMLKANGIDRVYEYASPEQKRELLKQFPELMFMFGGMGLLGAGMMYDNGQDEQVY